MVFVDPVALIIGSRRKFWRWYCQQSQLIYFEVNHAFTCSAISYRDIHYKNTWFIASNGILKWVLSILPVHIANFQVDLLQRNQSAQVVVPRIQMAHAPYEEGWFHKLLNLRKLINSSKTMLLFFLFFSRGGGGGVAKANHFAENL